jgi:hypothetical protein
MSEGDITLMLSSFLRLILTIFLLSVCVENYKWTTIVNPSNGRSGGVLLFWKKEIKLQQIFSAPKYIDVQISENDKVWRLKRGTS